RLMLDEGADRPGWIMMTSGRGDYHRTFGTPRERVPVRGDMIWIDLAAVVGGYWSDFARAGVLGGPSADQATTQAAVGAAGDAGTAAVAPGVPVAEVAAAAIRALERSGHPLAAPGRVGHGLGLLSTEPPDVSLDDPTVLQPGMVITLEPTIVREDGIFQAELD